MLADLSEKSRIGKIKAMKQIQLISLLLMVTVTTIAQDMKSFNLYKPDENAKVALEKAVSAAKASGKNVFVQIGGNWCVWCARFNDFVTKDVKLDSLINANFIVYHMNYSKENYNRELLKRFNFPQRFGFPVFIVLDSSGKQLHTQNSAYLEEGQGYNRDKVVEFFQHWAPAAFDEKLYKNF